MGCRRTITGGVDRLGADRCYQKFDPIRAPGAGRAVRVQAAPDLGFGIQAPEDQAAEIDPLRITDRKINGGSPPPAQSESQQGEHGTQHHGDVVIADRLHGADAELVAEDGDAGAEQGEGGGALAPI